jgi:hypothetical protein
MLRTGGMLREVVLAGIASRNHRIHLAVLSQPRLFNTWSFRDVGASVAHVCIYEIIHTKGARQDAQCLLRMVLFLISP